MYFVNSKDANINEFKKTCEVVTDISNYPLADGVNKNILIYDGDRVRKLMGINRKDYLEEIHHALNEGPGVIVIRKFYFDPNLMELGNKIFYQIISEERQQSKNQGDHFAKGSPNARIWNVVEKLLDADPKYFYEYFKNPLLPLVAQSWLGPAYQVTAQVNLVRPGSAAQTAHRDYHLGFLDDEVIVRYPITAQMMSQYLTLQGAIAHCDMPLISGPTLLLPHSQKYKLGYVAMRQKDFIDYFNQNAVQNELKKGDAIFFSPALFHAAGENRSSDIERMANLLQISSSFGRPMEKVNWVRIAEKIYPMLLKKIKTLDHPKVTPEVESVIFTVASGYPFPNNLDVMQPQSGSLTPPNDQGIFQSHLLAGKSPEEFRKALMANQV